MSPAALLAASEGFFGEADRRKRLGQYFSGIGLARLLGALSGAEKARSIIDPMAGSGDMLAGCLALGARPEFIGAIEIDPAASAICSERVADVQCRLGSAFDPAILAALPRHEWDLVITNPPYVRYQSMTKGAGKNFKLPGAVEVRNGLMKALDSMTALDETDRNLFRALVSGYSGLADLAVPSWILCAAMTSVGGRLALVVPESWLSRDYAAVVQYLLLRWFRIEHIVEDEHAAWFNDAQVKTTLLIARRVVRRDGAFEWGKDDCFTYARVSGKATDTKSPIARLYAGKTNPEALFAAKAKKVLNSRVGFEEEFVSFFPAPLGRVAENLKAACSKQKWFTSVGEKDSGPVACVPPDALASWLNGAAGRPLVPLESLGVSVGQGLRTGANGFFYATLISDNGTEALISPNRVPGIREAEVPMTCLRPVVRRQSELPASFTICEDSLMGRVLDLRTHALPEDIKEGGSDAQKSYAPMPNGLASFVRDAALANFGTDDEPRRIYELSAVAPNMRKGNLTKGIAPQFWYMLPDFAPRHLPEILVPRVNGGTPKAWLVVGRRVLVDANFATLRVNGKNGPDTYAILALINSAWCRAALEYGASVMGGGALKVEAAHLRRMPVPKLRASEWRRLSAFGRRLADDGEGIEDINKLIASALLGRAAKQEERAALSRLADEGKERRANHKKSE